MPRLTDLISCLFPVMAYPPCVAFNVGIGDLTQVLLPAQQALCPLSPLFTSKSMCSYFYLSFKVNHTHEIIKKQICVKQPMEFLSYIHSPILSACAKHLFMLRTGMIICNQYGHHHCHHCHYHYHYPPLHHGHILEYQLAVWAFAETCTMYTPYGICL